jgi:hypothetical protein
MIGRGFAALASLPDTPAQREAADRMYRIQAHAVDAQERCDAAEARRDAALEEQKQAQAVVDAARASLLAQLVERADALGRRMDAFERKRNRDFLDSLPDPDNANPGGELSPIGPTGPLEARPTAGDDSADARDGNGILPDPDDPTGTSLQL